MRLDMLISVGHNHGVCVVQIRAVKHVSCPCLKPAGNHHQGASLTAFALIQSVLRTIAVGLHGPLGRKHRLTSSPVARRLDSQRGTRQHAFDKGGNSKGMEGIAGSKLRWQGIRSTPCGRGRVGSSPGWTILKTIERVLSAQHEGLA